MAKQTDQHCRTCTIRLDSKFGATANSTKYCGDCIRWGYSVRDLNRRYYERNRERIQEASREYGRTHKQQAKERSARWQKKNREERNAYMREWRRKRRSYTARSRKAAVQGV